MHLHRCWIEASIHRCDLNAAETAPTRLHSIPSISTLSLTAIVNPITLWCLIGINLLRNFRILFIDASMQVFCYREYFLFYYPIHMYVSTVIRYVLLFNNYIIIGFIDILPRIAYVGWIWVPVMILLSSIYIIFKTPLIGFHFVLFWETWSLWWT